MDRLKQPLSYGPIVTQYKSAPIPARMPGEHLGYLMLPVGYHGHGPLAGQIGSAA